MPSLSIPYLLAVAAITFIAAFVQGVTGFGSALLAMPLLAMFINVRAAAPLVALLSLAINVSLLIPVRGRLPWRRVAPLLAGALLGVPAGVFFLAGADEKLARMALGAVIVVSSVVLLWSDRFPIPGGWRAAFTAGGLSGLLGGAFNTSGPPVMLYAAAQNWSKEETHAALQLYFLVSGLGIAGLHAVAGLTDRRVLLSLIAALPALALGSYAGWRVHRRVSEGRFRRLVQVALLAAGLALLIL